MTELPNASPADLAPSGAPFAKAALVLALWIILGLLLAIVAPKTTEGLPGMTGMGMPKAFDPAATPARPI